MQIETWPIDRPKPYENNPRLNDDAVESVARSIREFGFRQPIVVDEDGVVIIGHTRLKAAKKLGLTEVPVHVARELSPEKIKALRIADNKTAEIAEWNLELLPIELSELQGMDFDLDLLGFDQDELAKLLGPGVQEGLTDADEVPEPPDEADHAAGRPVDSWRAPSAVRRQFVRRGCGPAAGRSADPPRQYRPAVQCEGGTAQQQRHRCRPLLVRGHQTPPVDGRRPASGEVEGRRAGNCGRRTARWPTTLSPMRSSTELLDAWFGNCARVLAPGRAFYIWGGYANCRQLPASS